jgi:hypothetical protein
MTPFRPIQPTAAKAPQEPVQGLKRHSGRGLGRPIESYVAKPGRRQAAALKRFYAPLNEKDV